MKKENLFSQETWLKTRRGFLAGLELNAHWRNEEEFESPPNDIYINHERNYIETLNCRTITGLNMIEHFSTISNHTRKGKFPTFIFPLPKTGAKQIFLYHFDFAVMIDSFLLVAFIIHFCGFIPQPCCRSLLDVYTWESSLEPTKIFLRDQL